MLAVEHLVSLVTRAVTQKSSAPGARRGTKFTSEFWFTLKDSGHSKLIIQIEISRLLYININWIIDEKYLDNKILIFDNVENI
jgi:hypothetical protein